MNLNSRSKVGGVHQMKVTKVGGVHQMKVTSFLISGSAAIIG